MLKIKPKVLGNVDKCCTVGLHSSLHIVSHSLTKLAELNQRHITCEAHVTINTITLKVD